MHEILVDLWLGYSKIGVWWTDMSVVVSIFNSEPTAHVNKGQKSAWDSDIFLNALLQYHILGRTYINLRNLIQKYNEIQVQIENKGKKQKSWGDILRNKVLCIFAELYEELKGTIPPKLWSFIIQLWCSIIQFMKHHFKLCSSIGMMGLHHRLHRSMNNFIQLRHMYQWFDCHGRFQYKFTAS